MLNFRRLFESGMIGNVELKNRIIRAAVHTGFGALDGTVTPRHIAHYKQGAMGGCGMVIVEFAYVDNEASKVAREQIGVAGDEHIYGLAWLAQTIQECGSKACLQIVHAGNKRGFGTPKAPSREPAHEGAIIPEELNFEEIQKIVEAFGDAARRTMIAGFDMLEIHGAHGYVITNFLSPRTNRRTDLYGGNLENRMRFLLEIICNVRSKVGPDYPVVVRLSGSEYLPDGITIEETIKVAKALEKAGVNAIHVSGGDDHLTQIYTVTPMSLPLSPNAWAAEAIKKEIRIPVIVAGSITTPELAEEILERGKADFIALARPLLADPYWSRKAKEGRPEDIAPCIRCNECLERGYKRVQAIRCTVNVLMGKEGEFGIAPADKAKTVAVVGGGPAGMEAARVAALRGHKVTLYEKRKLGGVLHEASFPEFKSDLRRLISYFVTQMEKLKVKVVYEEATVDTIKDKGFDAVIVAVGATSRKLDVPGIDKPIVTDVMEVLDGKAHPGERVHVVGGGMVGVEVAVLLAEQGKEVTITTRGDDFMTGVGYLDQRVYEGRLREHTAKIHTGKRLEKVLDKGSVVVDRYGNRDEILADSIVLNSGFAPQTTLTEQLRKETNLEVYAVGDCVSPRKIFDAIHEGHLAARWL